MFFPKFWGVFWGCLGKFFGVYWKAFKRKISENYRKENVKRPLNNIKKLAATNVDRISVGALTHSVKALDLKFEI